MQKKVLLVFLVLGIVLIVGGGIWYVKSKQQSLEVISPLGPASESSSENIPTVSQAKDKLLLWTDPAGFTFQYPAEVKINKHPEDQTNYAHLDFYIEGKDGAVKILASDTKYKSAEEWATKDKKNSQAGGGTEITLADKPGRKIAFSDTQAITAAVVDGGILFTIEMVPDKEGFWQKTFDQIVSSFKLVYPTQAPVSGSSGKTSGGASGDVIEEEEIVE